MTQPTVRTLIATALVTWLSTDSALVTPITDAKYGAKFFLLAAPGDTNLPYIRFNHTFGGEPPHSPRREFDQTWMICAIAFSQPQAQDLDAELRSMLVGTRLTFTDNWLAWVGITVIGEYSEVTNIQGQEAWVVGAYYRIRGIKET